MQNPFEEIHNRLNKIEELLEKNISCQKADNDILSVSQAAQLLNYSEQSIRLKIKQGIIPATKVGKKYLIEKNVLLDSRKQVKSLKYKR